MADLAEIGDDLVTYLNLYIYEVEHADDLKQRAMAAVAVSRYYEALGMCELLLDAAIDTFAHHLIRSAQTRRWLLQQSVGVDGYPRKALKASNVKPLCAAITANQLNLARDIAELSPKTWFSDVEYEDDFCYAHFLHRYLAEAPAEELVPVLDRFERVLEGASAPRLDLCRVLVSGEQNAGEEAFLRLLQEREEKIETIKKESAYWDGRDALLYPNTVLFLEGLAWMRLLEQAGISLDEEYRYCPSLAWRTGYGPFQVTTFPSVPL